MQLTGEHFQIYDNGVYFHSLLPARTLSRYGVIGADLGYPVVYPDKIVILFGDTMSAASAGDNNFNLAAGFGGADSIGYIPNTDLAPCHYIDNVDQKLRQGVANPSVSAENCPAIRFYTNPHADKGEHIYASTKIAKLQSGEGLGPYMTPSGAFDFNDRLYMFYVTKIQDAKPHFALQSILAKSDQSHTDWSDNNPPTFTRLYTVSSHEHISDENNLPDEQTGTGKFMFNPVVALDAATLASANLRQGLPAALQNSSKVVLVFGSSWRYNRSNLYLAAFSANDVEAGTSKWFYYSGNGAGANSWSQDEKSAAPLLPDAPRIGNHSVAWNPALKSFVLMYGNVAARFSPTPWGPWSDPVVVLGPQSAWATKLIHHPGADPLVRSLIPVNNPRTGKPADLDKAKTGVPYGPYVLDKFTQNADGSVTIYFTMSTWHPYQVFLVSTTLRSSRVQAK